MALPPKFAGHKLIVSSRTAHPHTLELCRFTGATYESLERTLLIDVPLLLLECTDLDYVCPVKLSPIHQEPDRAYQLCS
jgi:hypothetical protein